MTYIHRPIIVVLILNYAYVEIHQNIYMANMCGEMILKSWEAAQQQQFGETPSIFEVAKTELPIQHQQHLVIIILIAHQCQSS